MRRAAIAVVLLALLAGPVNAAPNTLGTLSMEPVAPHYGDTITVSWDNDRTARVSTVGILCFNDPYEGIGSYDYILERGVERSKTGSVELVLDNEHSGGLVHPGTLDYTKVAHCAAGMWNERASTGKGPVALTPFISFDVPAE